MDFFHNQRTSIMNSIANHKATMMDALKAKEAAEEQYKHAELDLYGSYGALQALEAAERATAQAQSPQA